MRITLLALSCLLSTVAVAQAKASLTTDPAYEKNCAKCHGKEADGRRFGGKHAPNLAETKLSDDELKTLIVNGKGKMPAFQKKLTADEISGLAKEIKEFSKH